MTDREALLKLAGVAIGVALFFAIVAVLEHFR